MTSRARAKQRRREAVAGGGEGAPLADETPAPPAADRPSVVVGILTDTAIVLAAFAVASAIAAAAGAANFGTALAFGQIGFALAVTYVLACRR
jgi:hypothetical protein